MNCPKCNAEVESGERFCGGCGHPVAETTAPPSRSDMGICPNCGAKQQPSQRFCGSCGSSVTGAARSLPTSPLQVTEGSGRVPSGGVSRAISRFPFAALLGALSGFVLAAIATFLPWNTGRTSEWSITNSAWDDHAAQAVVILVLVAFGLLTEIAPLLYGGVRRMRWAQYLPVITGILIAAIGVDTYLGLNQGTVGTTTGTISLIIEIGPYVVIAGGIVAAIGSLLGLLGRRSTAGSS